MLKRFSLILGFMALSLVPYLVGCGDKEETEENQNSQEIAADETSERFILRNIYNKKYRWSDFVGQPFIVNFWATWCGPCRAEIPAMMKIYKEYQPRGLEIVAISLDGPRTVKQVVPFIDHYRIPWVVLYGDEAVQREFNLGNSIPVTLFFDAEGNETARLRGAQPEQIFRRELEKIFPDKRHADDDH